MNFCDHSGMRAVNLMVAGLNAPYRIVSDFLPATISGVFSRGGYKYF